jgi:glucose dehydrogenase
VPNRRRAPALLVLLGGLALWAARPATGQQGVARGEWRTWGGDLANTHYSPLDQINRDNFSRLEVAWRFKTDNLGARPEYRTQGTALMANGVLYGIGGARRAVFALDPGSGELLWKFAVDEGKRAEQYRNLPGRGVAYWTDGKEERILYITSGYFLVALDARTGRPIQNFGRDGLVDLKLEMDQRVDLVGGDLGTNAAPIIAGNTVIVGAAGANGFSPRSRTHEQAHIRGYDVRTGKRMWIFHTIPRPGEFGNDTWENDSWSYTGHAGVWTQTTVDEELGIVYLPVETPTGDYYGGHRPGNNLFGNSLVAVDLRTGKRLWHFQTTHHDIWDWDLPAAATLMDLTVNGKPVKAVAIPTKQNFLFVFDRVTGRPVWPIEERPVPKGDVPAEWYSPTQPFPTRPPPFDQQGAVVDNLIDFTPALRAEAIKVASRYKLGPIFTPGVVSRWEGPLGTLTLGCCGGANWPGGAFDPETKLYYVYSRRVSGTIGLVNDPKRSDMNFISGTAPNPAAPPRPEGSVEIGGGEGTGASLTVQGLPLFKPPWGTITAYDMNRGEIAWQVAHGETPDNVRNHAALKGLSIPRTGRPGVLGILVTKTLVIAGEAGTFTTPSGARGAMLRAYDKATGREVGDGIFLPTGASGVPMTYLHGGKQYVVIAVSGAGYSGEYLAFRLPQ